MKNKKWYEWMLTAVYFAMVVVCVLLNLMPGQREGLSNIIVNVAMFVIVGIIFLNCDINCFAPLDAMIDDLNAAAARIRRDALNARDYLWKQYEQNKVELFTNDRLRQAYDDYRFELDRMSGTDIYYKCGIEDYINDGMMDAVVHRDQLNQVAGALTGLGILGTFIGLSLGLQSFSTGSTAEITNSIAPLMSGIKVAFHTSIYGMIFSLVFNYVYKRKLTEADAAVTGFLSVYTKYVLPDTSNDGTNRIVSFLKQQTRATKGISESIGAEIEKALGPQFDRLNETVTGFANMATRSQQDALQQVVEAFIKEMNRSMGNAFAELSDTVDRQYKSQQQNALLMQNIMKETSARAGDLNEINRLTASLVNDLNQYSRNVNAVQTEIERNITSLSMQNDTNQLLLKQEQQGIKDMEALAKTFAEATDRIGGLIRQSDRNNEEYMKRLTEAVQELKTSLERQPSRGRRLF